MNRTTLIIGASSDIGIAIAKHRAKLGDQLILHFNSNKSVVAELAKEISNEQVLQIIQADLTCNEEIEKLLQNIVFHVDMIIFSSGKAELNLFQETTNESIKKMLRLHVEAPMRIIKHYLPSMIKSQFGRIILITSIWGEVGASYEVLYSTVKGAQNSFIRALAKEVAMSNITINGVSPGFIDTKMNLSISQEEREEIYQEIPLQRPGIPHEVAEAISFMIDRRFMNGQILPVTGGWMI